MLSSVRTVSKENLSVRPDQPLQLVPQREVHRPRVIRRRPSAAASSARQAARCIVPAHPARMLPRSPSRPALVSGAGETDNADGQQPRREYGGRAFGADGRYGLHQTQRRRPSHLLRFSSKTATSRLSAPFHHWRFRKTRKFSTALASRSQPDSGIAHVHFMQRKWADVASIPASEQPPSTGSPFQIVLIERWSPRRRIGSLVA